ncbi:hypothetical protein ZEAMMB73_Zm00001d046977 [Zea mays]|uniref:Uncharacterized protein n=1 Tax=Zea mays TaxID=4577 RepID=A0A1D6P5S8_MAIZE|nr:hypothetical protein ZEAMMB73_Zm00001d046977 [Zea mays]
MGLIGLENLENTCFMNNSIHKGEMILADDTCRILEILAYEYWSNHLAQNDSVIVDTCHFFRACNLIRCNKIKGIKAPRIMPKSSSVVISDVKCDNPKEEGKVQQTKRCKM